MNNEIIEGLATDFRNAIDSAKATGIFVDDIVMNAFPKGCCGDVTDLLGEYLMEHGIEDLWYVSGTHYPSTGDEEEDFYNIQTHAWLSIGNPLEPRSVYIDITCDQFKDKQEYDYFDKRVYVGEKGEFHSLFRVKSPDYYPFSGLESYNGSKYRLLSLYKLIVNHLEQSI